MNSLLEDLSHFDVRIDDDRNSGERPIGLCGTGLTAKCLLGQLSMYIDVESI